MLRDALHVALLGNPNVGKSLIFNQLTGAAQAIGNWCGTTTQICTEYVQYQGKKIAFTDLPGVYGLDGIGQEQERIDRFIQDTPPDIFLFIADAVTLERNFYLLIEALERFDKIAVIISKLDAAKDQGISIDTDIIAQKLQVPVIKTTATGNIDITQIYRLIIDLDAKEQTRSQLIKYSEKIEKDILSVINEHDSCDKTRALRWHAISHLLKNNDKYQVDIVSARYELAAKLASVAIKGKRIKSMSERIDDWILHPYFGIPIMVFIFSIMFYITFAVSKPMSEMLGGLFDIFGEVVEDSLLGFGASKALVSLITDGLINGIGATMGFLPQMVAFFLVYTFLQDSGYIVRVAFLMDRVMRAMGLSGKTFLPIIVGYSCNVNGIIAARILSSKYDRIVAILVSSFIPCSARLGVMVFLVSAFFSSEHATIVLLGLFLIGFILMALVAFLVGLVVKRDDDAAFMMELPIIMWPRLSTLLMTTGQKTMHFLARIKNVIIYSAVIMWFLSTYPQGQFENTYIARFGMLLEPIGKIIGLNWQLIVALLLGIAAKETTLTALGIMYHAAEAQGSISEVLTANIDSLTAFTFLVIYMIYIPCIPTLVTIYQEMKNSRLVIMSITGSLVVAFILGAVIYNIGRYIM